MSYRSNKQVFVIDQDGKGGWEKEKVDGKGKEKDQRTRGCVLRGESNLPPLVFSLRAPSVDTLAFDDISSIS